MINKLKNLIFPCETVMCALKKEHETAVNTNKKAHEALLLACGDGYITACGDFVFKADFSNGIIPSPWPSK